MNHCPRCGATGQLTLTPALAAKPAGSYPLPGAHDKTAADAARLSCAACRWRATGPLQGQQAARDGATTGTITGGHLLTEQPPPTATPPARHPAGQAPTLPRQEPPPRRYWSAALGRHVTIPDDQDDPR